MRVPTYLPTRRRWRCVRQVFVPNEAPYVKIVLIVLVLFAAIVLQVGPVGSAIDESRVPG